MAIERKNYAGQVAPDTGDVLEFVACNFAHEAPAMQGATAVPVRLWPGDNRPRQFRDCNMVNAAGPDGSTYENCNTAIVSRAVVVEDVRDAGNDDGQDEIETVTVFGRRDEAGNVQRRLTPAVSVRRRELPDPSGLSRAQRQAIVERYRGR